MFNMTALFSLVVGLYSLGMILINSEKKTTEKMKIQVLTFSAENDPEAEHLLLDMWPQMMRDSVLKKMMDAENFQNNYDFISDHLSDTYFNGYWGNYNYIITLCRNDEPLQIVQSGEMVDNCFDFFNERITKIWSSAERHRLLVHRQPGRKVVLPRAAVLQAKPGYDKWFIH